MPSLKRKVENKQCIIDVFVHYPLANEKDRRPRSYPFRALIDTGAQRTCISKRAVDALQLLLTSKAQMISASGTHEANLYRAGILIPIDDHIPVTEQSGESKYQINLSLFGKHNMLVSEFSAPENFDVLLGMDILARCILLVAHDEFILSY